jgi:glycosyltransferase involved in cell wall biosynthesis
MKLIKSNIIILKFVEIRNCIQILFYLNRFKSMSLTILFAYRDREVKRVKECLDSLSRQTDPSFHVIFVDYGTEGVLKEEIAQLVNNYSFCKYLYSNAQYLPWNKAHALNTAIRVCYDQFVLIADVDLIFHPDFVATAKSKQDETKAIYFPMAYLSKNAIGDIAELKRFITSISGKTTLGFGLIPIEALMRIRGFDEFYSYWGHEDTDLESRLRLIGKQSEFYDKEILLFHQWHEKIPDNPLLMPQSWLLLKDDYLKYYGSFAERNTSIEWGEMLTLENRIALQFLEEHAEDFIPISCRIPFLRFWLQQNFNITKSGECLYFRYRTPDRRIFEAARTTKVASKIQYALKRSGLSLTIKNNYFQYYPTLINARDEVSFFLLSNRGFIADSALIYTNDYIDCVVCKC